MNIPAVIKKNWGGGGQLGFKINPLKHGAFVQSLCDLQLDKGLPLRILSQEKEIKKAHKLRAANTSAGGPVSMALTIFRTTGAGSPSCNRRHCLPPPMKELASSYNTHK